jgi:hypothetical protein
VTDRLLAEILAALDLVVFERLPDGVFLRLGGVAPPRWFTYFVADAAQSQSVTLGQVFPFLEHFLVDAEAFWADGREQRLRSEPFTTTDRAGGEITLVASALSLANRRFLVIELPQDFEEHRQALQRGREHLLAHEEQIRLTAALLGPVGAARKLAQQLVQSELTAGQQQLAAGIDDHLTQASDSIEKLAPLPKGMSRRPPR